MKKILIGLFTLLLTTSNAFALELSQGKVLRHKEWTTGNIIKATYTHSTNLFSPEIEKLLSKKDELISSLYTFSATDTQSGKLNEPVSASGYSSTIMMNGSREVKTYSYSLETCISPVEGQQNCSIYHEIIEIAPNSAIFRTVNPSIQFVFDKAGSYPITVRAAVQELSTPSTSVSVSFGKMDITE